MTWPTCPSNPPLGTSRILVPKSPGNGGKPLQGRHGSDVLERGANPCCCRVCAPLDVTTLDQVVKVRVLAPQLDSGGGFCLGRLAGRLTTLTARDSVRTPCFPLSPEARCLLRPVINLTRATAPYFVLGEGLSPAPSALSPGGRQPPRREVAPGSSKRCHWSVALAFRRVARVAAPVTHPWRSKRFNVLTRHPSGDPRKLPERRAGRQSSTSHPLRAVETEFRSSAPACDKANFQKSGSGLRRESHDEPKVQRTQSMTGKSGNPNKIDRRGLWWTERVGVPSFGTVHLPRIDPCDGSSAAPARILPRKTSAQHRLSRYVRFLQTRFCVGNPIGVV